jgi:hypothetical protein
MEKRERMGAEIINNSAEISFLKFRKKKKKKKKTYNPQVDFGIP